VPIYIVNDFSLYCVYSGSALNHGREANTDLNIHGSQHNQLPAFGDPTVISKIAEFHVELASLDPIWCSTCYEKFSSISVNGASTCAHCHNDKHIPKLFSANNNMDPGSVPPELIVSNTLHIYILHVH